MYQKPDFVRVSVKVKDVFANYLQTGCPHDETQTGTKDYTGCMTDSFVAVLTEIGWDPSLCYSEFNP